MTKVCVVCHNERPGVPIRDDPIIRFIRRAKKSFRVSSGNVLVVCAEHIDEAKKRRERFEKSLLTSAGLGAVLGLILVVIAILGGGDLVRIGTSLVFLVFLVLIMAALSLYQYFPAIETAEARPSVARPSVARQRPVRRAPVRHARR